MARPSAPQLRFALGHVAVPALLLGAILGLLAATDLDARVADAFFDPASGRFPARSAHGLAHVLHVRGRDLVALAGLAALGTVAASFASRRARRYRWRATCVAAAVILTTVTVSAWKSRSPLHCPWSYEPWGGDVPFEHALAPPPPGSRDGHCFPGGHSSGGWSLLGLHVAARAGGRRRAWAWLLPGLVLGSAFSVVQWSRGAHFPSHDVVSAGVAWAWCLVLHAVLGKRMADEAGAVSAA